MNKTDFQLFCLDKWVHPCFLWGCIEGVIFFAIWCYKIWSIHSAFPIQELIHIYITTVMRKSRQLKREPKPFTAGNFHTWCSQNLKSPRSVWLYSMAFSFGSMLVILRAAIRFAVLFFTDLSNKILWQGQQCGDC